MKRLSADKRFIISVMMAFAMAVFSVDAFAQDARVNLILDNGTVLIYKAREAGYVEGQKLNVVRGHSVVGTVVVTRVQPTFAQAQILPGSGGIQEYDALRPAPGMPEPAHLSPPLPEVRKISPPPQEKEVVVATSRKRETASKLQEPTRESIGGSSGSASRSRRRSDGEESFARSAPGTPPPKIQRAPEVVSFSAPYVFHIGYLSFNQHIPVDVDTSADPTPMLALDYWRPRDESRNIVYNLSYSRPESNYELSGRRMRSQLDIYQLSINYIWSAFNSKNFGETGLYGGVGAGYRTASIKTVCESACDGLTQDNNKRLSDVDYHGIVGYRFNKNYELKLDYCFDEDYYGITFGLGGRKKRQAVKVAPEPEPAPVVRVVRKPEPEIEEEPEEEPAPEPEPVKTQAPEAIFMDRPAQRIEKPVVVYLSEPEPVVKKNIYTYVSEPEIEKKVIVLVFEDIHFEFDSSAITPQAREILKRSIKILKDNPSAKVRLAGYTSASGAEDYNQKLSERRAAAIMKYLVEEGLISPDRLVTIGYGEANPETYEVAPKDLYSPAAKSNMRVLFEIVVK